ncbi:MAG: hypothetical protein R3D25_12880 [Geminicoccaceae bacterium]
MIPGELLPDAARRLAQFAAITERLEARTATWRSASTISPRPDDPMARALAAGHLERNFHQGYTTDRATTC